MLPQNNFHLPPCQSSIIVALGEQLSLNGKFNPRSAVAAKNNPESEHIEKVSHWVCSGYSYDQDCWSCLNYHLQHQTNILRVANNEMCCYLLHWTMDNWTYCFFFNCQLLRKWSVQVGVCQRNGDRANTNTISNFGEIQLVLWIRRGECARSGTDTLQTGEIHVMSADTSWFALSTLSWYTGSQLAGRPLIYNLAGKFQWKLNCSCLLNQESWYAFLFM